jgi:hypothetical protein
MSFENLRPTATAFVNSINNTMPGGPLVDRAMPGTPQQGMFQPYMPMYQFQPTDGISSAVSQISGGMGDEYTNRLLGALGLGDVGQYQMQQPMYQPMPFYNPYMNPYAGMFSPFMQLTPDGRQQFESDSDTTQTGWKGMDSVGPSFGLMGILSSLFGSDNPDTSSSSFDPTGDGSDYDTSNTDSFDPTGDGSDYDY